MIPVFPSDPFELVCEATSESAPGFAQSEFRIRINLKKGTYAFPHFNRDLPIQRIDRDQLIFRDETIPAGMGSDGGPEFWRITYDPSSQLLHYRGSFNGRMHIDWDFTTKCRIA